jgi:hypothetical protein
VPSGACGSDHPMGSLPTRGDSLLQLRRLNPDDFKASSESSAWRREV